MINKTLIICPTKDRVNLCRRMMFSVYATKSASTDIIFIVSDKDKMTDNYSDLFEQYNTRYHIFPFDNITEIFNNTLLLYPGYKYYHLTNDDFFYQTQNWDQIFIDKIEQKGGSGIAYGNDLLTGQDMPTAPFISSDIVRMLGWLQMPKLKFLYGDAVWKVIGSKLNKLYYCKDVIIRHDHPFFKNGQHDDTSKITNSKEMYEHDHSAFKDWIQNDYLNDIKKIEEELNVNKG